MDTDRRSPDPKQMGASGVAGLVADTKFSNRRGFHPSPFDLTITTATPGASIRYTTDGWRSTNVDTHTYVLVDEVVTQTQASVQTINGLPATWKGTAAYYGMNGNNSVVNPATHPTLKQEIPSILRLHSGWDTLTQHPSLD